MQTVKRVLCGVAALVVCLNAAGQPPGPRPYGFSNPLETAELQKLPQTPGAKGDQERHYFFKEAGREMPYHLYVPSSYDPNVGAPLVVALHGYGGNQDYFFAVVKDDLQALCDRYGYIFVAPMGYSVSGWYGAPMSVPGGPPPTSGNQPARALPPPQTGTPEEQLRERRLSEQDVLNVVELVKKEYKIDPRRVYLMGHSMGGFGAWYLGAQHADLWAAVAPMSGTRAEHAIDIKTLSKLPVLVAVGGEEVPTVAASKAKVDQLKAAGGVTAYVEIEKGTHMSMIPPSMPQVFEFFSKHAKP
ncbi:MAG: alpha/beta fold hydrolase [Gammaproteobacteria bacterium]